MMGMFFRGVLIGAAASTVITSPASANNYLFRGDCDVARQYQANVSLKDILPRQSYRGIQGRRQKSGNCFIDLVRTYELSNPRYTQGEVVFSVRETAKNIGSTAPACANVTFKTGTGTAKFEIRRFNVTGKCEIRISSEFSITYPNSENVAKSLGYFARLNDYSFSLTRPDLTSRNLYSTPISFAAIGSQ